MQQHNAYVSAANVEDISFSALTTENFTVVTYAGFVHTINLANEKLQQAKQVLPQTETILVKFGGANMKKLTSQRTDKKGIREQP